MYSSFASVEVIDEGVPWRRMPSFSKSIAPDDAANALPPTIRSEPLLADERK